MGSSNQDANSSQSIVGSDVTDSNTRSLLEQEIFKIDAYTNLVLQYLRLENFHDDLQLKQVALEHLVKELLESIVFSLFKKG